MEQINNVLQSLKITGADTLEVWYEDGVKVNLEDMKQLLEQIYSFTGNKKLKRLIVISRGASLELPARIYLQDQNKSRKDSIIAEAVVVTSLAQKMTTNFYLKFIKDLYPSRFFTDIEKARDWLKNQETK